jgi:hypothetical protein
MERLGLSGRIISALNRAEIHDLEALFAHDQAALARVPGIGRAKLHELKRAMLDHFGSDRAPQDPQIIRQALIGRHQEAIAQLKYRRREINQQISIHNRSIKGLQESSIERLRSASAQ